MPPRSAPPAPMPIGYMLLGMVLVVVGLGCAAAAASSVGVFGRAVFGLVAMLSLVLVEALWWMRPWVGRAVDAWAAACVGVVFLPVVAAAVTMGFGAFAILAIAALILVGC